MHRKYLFMSISLKKYLFRDTILLIPGQKWQNLTRQWIMQFIHCSQLKFLRIFIFPFVKNHVYILHQK
jgi:hypothetical protein